MKMIEQKFVPIGFVAVVLAAVFGITQAAYCQAEGYYCLIIQQSPVDAGYASPGVGVHRMEIGEHVTLTAIPKPGYRFVYWMGNVSDASASEAIVVMDAPKIVVAVFERAVHELLLGGGGFVGGQGRGGGLVGVGGDYSRSGVSPGRFIPSSQRPFIFPDLPEPPVVDESDDLPVPGNDFPVPGEDNPVPEPATVVLLGVGGLMLFWRKKR